MASTSQEVSAFTPEVTAKPALTPEPHTILSSTLQHFKNSSFGVVSLFDPMAIPWMLSRAGVFAFFTVPERIDSFLGLQNGGSAIAEATGNRSHNLSSPAASVINTVQGTAQASAGQAAAIDAAEGGFFSYVVFQHLRSFGGIFNYLLSKWAFACLVLAIVLNRTKAYASGRRRIYLTWPLRLALRILPILLLATHSLSLLQAIHCQASPNRSSAPNTSLYRLISALLFWQSDEQSCLALNMIQPGQETSSPTGSLSLLWPFFQSLCISQFVETLSFAVQGISPVTETGMSVFEHSLAFAEAEGVVMKQLGATPWGSPKRPTQNTTSGLAGNATAVDFASLGMLYDRVNTPSEVLLMALISSFNSLSTHILAVLGMKGRFRLLNTGVWGLCFMGSLLWGLLSLTPEAGVDAMILRFPTVCIVGFTPHLILLIGISLCASIYLLALMLAVLSPPEGLRRPQSWRESFQIARDNLQVNTQVQNFQIRAQDDFYSALLKLGFAALTVATEAVFLNEGRKIGVSRWTWLEEDRLKEIENYGQPIGTMFGDAITEGVSVTEELSAQPHEMQRSWKSGYSRERTTKILKSKSERTDPRAGADGVGMVQRGGRYIMAWEFFYGIFWLSLRWFSILLSKILDTAGITWRPGPLRPKPPKEGRSLETSGSSQRPGSIDFWLLSDDGHLSLPKSDDVDVEHETKKRLQIAADRWGPEEERYLDSTLYGWWAHGGWWGERDDSGSYRTPADDEDDDTTSVISNTTTNENDWESEDSGAHTPTQRHPYFRRSISPSSDPVTDHTIDPAYLARLLNPKDLATRQEARMLATHLASNTAMTRSQYRHAETVDRSRLLTSTRHRPPGFKPSLPNGRLTPVEEAEVLEYLILSRRASSSSAAQPAETWRNGAEGLGDGGPQCVVCQSAPRTILAWPCRCLCICEECRVSLAMNNFATCVCCRTDVVGFSRLFVP